MQYPNANFPLGIEATSHPFIKRMEREEVEQELIERHHTDLILPKQALLSSAEIEAVKCRFHISGYLAPIVSMTRAGDGERLDRWN